MFKKPRYGPDCYRSCQNDWFDEFSWLHFDPNEGKVYCFKCIKNSKTRNSNRNKSTSKAFTHEGFCNWRKGKEGIKKHGNSKEHRDSIEVFAAMEQTPIDEKLNDQKIIEKATNRQCLLKVMDNLRFLAMENIGIRGKETKDSKIYKLVKLQGKYDPDLKNWLKKRRGNYLAPKCQNEMLKIMGDNVLQQVLEPVKKAKFFGIMVDETCDVSNTEQAAIVIRWVNDNYQPFEEFIGLRALENTTADYIFDQINDVLKMAGLDPKKIRSQCYDGAANMSGKKSGVATQFIEKVDKRALFNHCNNHVVNLAVEDCIKICLLVKNALSNAFEIITLVKWSPRRDATLDRVKKEGGDTSPGVRMLCPTRWTVKAASLRSILNNWSALIKSFEINLEETKKSMKTDMKARVQGIISIMEKFETYFGIQLAYMVLMHTDCLAKSLQKGNLCAAQGFSLAMGAVSGLEEELNNFDNFWLKVTKNVKKISAVAGPNNLDNSVPNSQENEKSSVSIDPQRKFSK